MSICVGIDGSRNRSGGAKGHLIGILNEEAPLRYEIKNVHVWSYKELLDLLPERPWLVKHNPSMVEGSIGKQVLWQRFCFAREAREAGCSIVLNTDAGSVANFHPCVTMSRDMLSYEPGEIERFGWGSDRARLILLRFMQNVSLRKADGAIFLTRHAANVIQNSCGPLSRIAFVPHGVSDIFRYPRGNIMTWPAHGERAIECIYVSPTWLFKHQWVVVKAISSLRKRGHNLRLTLIGGGESKAQRLLEREMDSSCSGANFVRQFDFVSHDDLVSHMGNADLFIFASSCENMPNTLLEGMSAGLPIACSNRGPMPEVLQDGGVYFDPENADSIANAIEKIIQDSKLRSFISRRAKALSEQYSWSRCADETWEFIASTYRTYRKKVGQ